MVKASVNALGKRRTRKQRMVQNIQMDEEAEHQVQQVAKASTKNHQERGLVEGQEASVGWAARCISTAALAKVVQRMVCGWWGV